MKKKSKVIVLVMSAVLLMTGCGSEKPNPPKEQETMNMETGNPFDLNEIETGNMEVMASYGYEITNMDCEKRMVEYDGNEISFDFCYNNCAAECNVGMVMFIDGIAQKYSLDGSKEKKIITPVHLEKESKCNFNLKVEPDFGSINKDHEMFFACMYEPDYVAPKQNAGYGNFQSILPMLPWKLTYENQKVIEDIEDTYKTSKMTDELKKEFTHKKMDGTIVNEIEREDRYKLMQNNSEIESSIQSKDGKADFQIDLFGGGECKYRLSAYVDNELVNAFGGKEYLDISTKEGQVSTADLSISMKEYEPSSIHSFYIFMVPISDEGFRDEYMIEKTTTVNILG